jgi:hypothetical protein
MAHSQIGRVAHVPPSSESIQYRGPCRLFPIKAWPFPLAFWWHFPHGVNGASTLRCTPSPLPISIERMRTSFFFSRPNGGALLLLFYTKEEEEEEGEAQNSKLTGIRIGLHKVALPSRVPRIVVSRQMGAYEI